MRYGVVNAAGEITKVVTGSELMARKQCGAGETLIPDCPMDATNVINGVSVKVVPESEKLQLIRAQRNALLTSCDWTQLPDAPADKDAWGVYRQALRDFPESCDPDNPVWPIPPV